jgi:membrane protein involved in colicin uptake
MTAASKVLTDQQDRLADSAQKIAGIMRDQADALEDQIAAAEDAAGATLNLSDAQDDFARAVHESTAKQNDAKASSEEKADAVKAERDAMIKAAEAARAKADADAVASGATQSATGKIDSYNTSLLNNARFATPAARDAISDFINEANQVPASKATDIKAAIARGDFDTAKVLLDQASATRTAAIKADATNTAAASAELDAIANKNRTALINPSVGKVTYRAGGGTVRPGEDLTVVGEEGPELVSLPAGSHVYPNGQTPAGMGTGGTPIAASGGNTYNISVQMPPGSDGRDVVRTIKRYERYNGTGWRS